MFRLLRNINLIYFFLGLSLIFLALRFFIYTRPITTFKNYFDVSNQKEYSYDFTANDSSEYLVEVFFPFNSEGERKFLFSYFDDENLVQNKDSKKITDKPETLIRVKIADSDEIIFEKQLRTSDSISVISSKHLGITLGHAKLRENKSYSVRLSIAQPFSEWKGSNPFIIIAQHPSVLERFYFFRALFFLCFIVSASICVLLFLFKKFSS